MRNTGVPMEIRSDHHTDFVATMCTVDLGVASVSRFHYPSLEALRTPALIRQSDPGVCQLALVLSGQAGITQDRQSVPLAVHEFGFLDYSRPSRMAHTLRHATVERSSAITLTLPRTTLPALPRSLPRHAMRMSGRCGVGALLRRYLDQLTRDPDQYRPGDLARLGTVSTDLLAAVLAHHLDTADALPPDSRDRVLLARVHAHIEAHLGDPGLCPQSIADAHHVSVRTLYRLFDARQTTVAGWIRARRLDRCRRDLADPSAARRPIGAIAARWGFTSAAHFSRCFRNAYGTSPQEYRRHHRADGGPGDLLA